MATAPNSPAALGCSLVRMRAAGGEGADERRHFPRRRRDDGGRGRDLPALMFDRAICGSARLAASPVAETAALAKLGASLNDEPRL